MTVFAIVSEQSETVGHYSGGGDANQIYRDIIVLNYPEKTVIGHHTIVGDSPPDSFEYEYTIGQYNPLAAQVNFAFLEFVFGH